MDGELKIKLGKVKTLKTMNANYPSSHQDHDEKFLFHAIDAIFSKDDIKSCSYSQSLRAIYGRTFLFFKGI